MSSKCYANLRQLCTLDMQLLRLHLVAIHESKGFSNVQTQQSYISAIGHKSQNHQPWYIQTQTQFHLLTQGTWERGPTNIWVHHVAHPEGLSDSLIRLHGLVGESAVQRLEQSEVFPAAGQCWLLPPGSWDRFVFSSASYANLNDCCLDVFGYFFHCGISSL